MALALEGVAATGRRLWGLCRDHGHRDRRTDGRALQGPNQEHLGAKWLMVERPCIPASGRRVDGAARRSEGEGSGFSYTG